MRCAAVVLATWSTAARAEEPAWLTWQAPPECPTGEHIAHTLEGWLGRPFGTDEAQVTASVTASVAGWDVNVTVVQRDVRGERNLRTRTCIEAADFVALSVALAVDPSLEASLPAPAPSSQQEPENEPSSASTERAGPPKGPSESRSAPSHIENIAAPVSPSPRHAKPEPTASTSATWHAQAGASFDAFTLPSARLGGAAELGVHIERVGLSLGAQWLPPVTESVPNAQSDVAFSRLAGRLRVSHLYNQHSLELSPYVEGQLGQLVADAVQANYQSRVLWAALGAGVQASWPAKRPFQLVGAVGALFPLTQSTFELSGGTDVHTVPPVTLEADLGLRMNF